MGWPRTTSSFPERPGLDPPPMDSVEYDLEEIDEPLIELHREVRNWLAALVLLAFGGAMLLIAALMTGGEP